MEEVSGWRRGFGGQTLTVTKISESALLYQDDRDESNDLWTFGVLNRILDRALRDPSFIHIRLIDEHGTTIFNRVQLHDVLPELRRLKDFAMSDVDLELLEDVWNLSQEVMESVHMFLVFMGD